MKLPLLLTSWLALSIPLMGQSPAATPSAEPHADVYSTAGLREMAQPIIEQARKSPDGSASSILQHYTDHFTMLATRVKDGKAEVHAH